MNFETLISLLPVVALLIAATNIIGEVIKKVIPKIPAQVVIAIVAVVLTVLAVIGYSIATGIVLMWYHYIGGIVGGLIVSYGAMFGYDNLYNKIAEAFKKGGQ